MFKKQTNKIIKQGFIKENIIVRFLCADTFIFKLRPCEKRNSKFRFYKLNYVKLWTFIITDRDNQHIH